VTRLIQIRVALAILGLVAFGYGIRTDDVQVRWVGIGLLAVAPLLRFIGPTKRR
jgi:hypothetical protein